MWKKIEQYWQIAYESLRIVAYRLLGKRYRYVDSLRAVQPGQALTRSQYLFCLLFPLLAILFISFSLAAVWIYAYSQFSPPLDRSEYYVAAPFWHIALQAIIVFLPLFASMAYFDLAKALRLLSKQSHQPPEQTQEQTGEWKPPQ